MDICRFCLKTIEKPLPINKMSKEIIGLLMLKLDLRITPEPVMCHGCAETLQMAFDFKSACIYTDDCLYPFIEGKSQTRLDLREIYLKVNDNEDVESVNGCEVCRFCMKLGDSGLCTPLDVIEENVEIKKLLENYWPDVVMGVIEKPVACENCLSFLHHYSLFVTSFSSVEQQIQSYVKTLGRDCDGEVDLRQVRDFSLSNVTKREVETMGNDKVTKEGVTIFSEIESEEKIIPEEKIEFEEKEISESKINMAALEILKREQEEFDGFTGNDELFTSNQIPVVEEAQGDVEMMCPFLESLVTEVKGKYLEEDAVHVEEVKGKSQKSQRNENYTLSLNIPSTIFSGDDEMKPAVADTTCNPEENHTAMKSDPDEDAPELETNPQVKGEVEDVKETIHRCKLCPYKAKLKCKLTKHMLVHKDISEVTAHRCKLCPYKTKRKSDLPKHMLIHKDSSEVMTYDCNFCSYKAKRKRNLTVHMLTHKDNPKKAAGMETVKLAEDVQEKKYNCKHCPYKTKRINSFNQHMLVHKDISEVTSYQCLLCPYMTKWKGNLTAHMLVHKDPSEVTTYHCNVCSFKTKRKNNLTTHMLVHKDNPKNAAEIGTSLPVELVKDVQETIHYCEHCPYKTKRINHFNEHLSVHQDISKVTSYQCALCPFKTKRKGNLTAHMLVHKDLSEVTTYDCNVCSFKTKRKNNLSKHMLVHKDNPKVTYRCKRCPYKAKVKYYLTKHMSVHEDISENAPEIETSLPVKSVEDLEGRIYRCDLCPYKAKLKVCLTRHLSVHKDISEVTSYQCILCPYKTKRKGDLTSHMLVHKDYSEVTTYDCNRCSYKAKRKSDLNRHMLTHKNNPKDAKSTLTQQESMSEQQEFEGCSTIKSEEVDIKDEEDECGDESNKL